MNKFAKKFSILSSRFSVVLLAIALVVLSFSGAAVAQRGTGTPIVYGTAFPTYGPYGVEFINTSTPALYLCINSGGCNSSQWTIVTGSGGTCSASCANLTLSNLSGTTAIPVPLYSATNTNLLVAGAAGTATYNPGTSSLVGGAAYSGSSQAGAATYVTGGLGGTSGGGAVYVESGGAVSGDPSGAVNIFTAPGVGAGAAGNLYLYAGNGGATGAGGNIFGQAGHTGTLTTTGNGYISLAGGGASYTTCSPLSGYQCAFLLLAGATGAGPGEIDLTGGGSTTGIVRLSNMSLAFYADATYPLNLATQRPTHAYFAGNVYATATSGGLTGAFAALTAGATLSTQNAANWHAEGPYGGTPVSQSGTMVLAFAAGGTLQYSVGGGAANTVATLTSNISGTSAGLSIGGTIAGLANGCLTITANVIQSTNSPCGTGSGSGVTSLTAGTGLTGGGVGAVTIGIANTGVTPGLYTNANVSVNAQGQITSIANGSAGSGYALLNAANTFVGNQTITGNLSVSGSITQTGSGSNEAIYTLNTTSLTTPASGSSAWGFDTIANGGLFKIYENGAAGYSVTTALASTVNVTGAQTIAGAKTFTSNMVVTGNLSVSGTLNLTGGGPVYFVGPYGTMPTPGSGNTGLGFGPSGVIQQNPNNTGWLNVPEPGHCSMATATSCTVALPLSVFTYCTATVQGSTPIVAACSISGSTATVTAASSNSDVWAVVAF